MTKKCGKNISDTDIPSCAAFLSLPHFDVIYNPLLKRHTATWNLFVHPINSQDLIVDSPLQLLHMSLEISIENFVLDQDNNFEPDEFEFSYNLFVG